MQREKKEMLDTYRKAHEENCDAWRCRVAMLTTHYKAYVPTLLVHFSTTLYTFL